MPSGPRAKLPMKRVGREVSAVRPAWRAEQVEGDALKVGFVARVVREELKRGREPKRKTAA